MARHNGGSAVVDVGIDVLVNAIHEALGQEGVGGPRVERHGEGEFVQVQAAAELGHVSEVEEHAVEPDGGVFDLAVRAGNHGARDEGAGVFGRINAAEDDVALRSGDVVQPDAISEGLGQAVLHQKFGHGGVLRVLLRGGEAEAEHAFELGGVVADAELCIRDRRAAEGEGVGVEVTSSAGLDGQGGAGGAVVVGSEWLVEVFGG